jgi:hypothetical protein
LVVLGGGNGARVMAAAGGYYDVPRRIELTAF